MHRALLGILVGLSATGTVRAGATDYFSELAKDFGTSPKGTVLQHYFTVTNKSAQPIQLGQPRVSCGCVSATVLNPQLAPGQSTAVLANMDTNRIPTPGVLKTVIVYVPVVTAGITEEVQLKVMTVTRSDLILSPDVLNLGTVRAGQPASAATKVTFYSDPNWTIKEARSTGVYLKPAVKAVGNGTHELTVTLDPKCPVGNWTADVYLTTTGLGVERLRVPVSVNVVPGVTLTPPEVAFGSVPMGKPVEKQLQVQLAGPFAVKEVKGGVSGLEVKPLAAAARPTQVFTVTFTPSAAGPAKGTLEILTDSKETPTVSVPWTATVVK